MNRRTFLQRIFGAIAATLLLPFQVFARPTPQHQTVELAGNTFAITKDLPDTLLEGQEVFVPTFELGVYPQVRLADMKARRFEIVDNIQSKSKEALFREEDQELLAAINASTLPPEGWGEKNYQSNSVKGWRE